MKKVQLLFEMADGMRALADTIQSIAEALDVSTPADGAQLEMPVQDDKPAPDEKAAAKGVTLEQVRAVLAEKSQDGFTAEVRALLEKHGAAKLSQIGPANYAALLADAERLK